MKKKIFGMILVLLLALVFSSCKPITSLSEGTVTVGLSGAADVDGDYLYAYVYLKGESDPNNPDRVLACGAELIASSSASMVLKVDDGNFEPTLVDWVGPGGAYDIYIYTDNDGKYTK